jgi:hypothetical protein
LVGWGSSGGGVEVAAEGEVEVDAILEDEVAGLKEGFLGVEGASLGFEDGDDVDEAAFVFIEGEGFGFDGFFGGDAEGGEFFAQVLFGGEGGFDFAEGDEDGLGINGDVFVGAGFLEVDVGDDTSALEDGLHGSGGDIPDEAFEGEKFGEIIAGEAAAGGEPEDGEELFFGALDTLEGGFGAAFGGDEVGASAEEFGGEAGGNIAFDGGEVEGGFDFAGGVSTEDGFVGAFGGVPFAHTGVVAAHGASDVGFGEADVEGAGDAALEGAVDDIVGGSKVVEGLAGEANLGFGFEAIEPGACGIGSEGEAGGVVIGGGGDGVVVGGGGVVAEAPPDVGFPVDVEIDAEIVDAIAGDGIGTAADEAAALGEDALEAAGGGVGVDLREEGGGGASGGGIGGAHAGGGGLEVAIVFE